MVKIRVDLYHLPPPLGSPLGGFYYSCPPNILGHITPVPEDAISAILFYFIFLQFLTSIWSDNGGRSPKHNILMMLSYHVI